MFAGRLTALGSKQAKGKANRRNAVRSQRGFVFPIKLLLLSVLLAALPLRVQAAGAIPNLIIQLPVMYISFTLSSSQLQDSFGNIRDFADRVTDQCHEELIGHGVNEFLCVRYVKECDIADQRFRVSVPKRHWAETWLNESENRYYGKVDYTVVFETLDDCIETEGNCALSAMTGSCSPIVWWREGKKVTAEGKAELRESDRQRAERIDAKNQTSQMLNSVLADKAAYEAKTHVDVFTGTNVKHNGETYVVKFRFSNAFLAEIMGVPISQVKRMSKRKKMGIITPGVLQGVLNGKKIPKGIKVKVKKVKG